MIIDVDDYDNYRLYNTGDQVWLLEGRVVQALTYDGVFWAEGNASTYRLRGWRKFLHLIEMFFFGLKKKS